MSETSEQDADTRNRAAVVNGEYRSGRPLDEALTELDRCSGTQFDPRVVEALRAYLRSQGAAATAIREQARHG